MKKWNVATIRASKGREKLGCCTAYDACFARLADDPEDVSAWTKSQFIYNNINLAELAEKLSRTFAVTFHFNTTEHLMDRFSISLRNNESLQDVMKALETLIPVRTRIEGDEVYVDKR